jgi:hypothetical protein
MTGIVFDLPKHHKPSVSRPRFDQSVVPLFLLLLFFLPSTEVAQLLHLADAQPPEVVCKKIQGA